MNTNQYSIQETFCPHIDVTPVDQTCWQCDKCGAISYHRDFGGIGQPTQRIWSKSTKECEEEKVLPETVEEAANDYVSAYRHIEKGTKSTLHYAFKNGAGWQKEQDRQLIQELVDALKEVKSYNIHNIVPAATLVRIKTVLKDAEQHIKV